jgi:hypothetical protein
MSIDLANHSSEQARLIHDFDQALVRKDVKGLDKYLHEDFRHITHPRSLGKPTIGREEWLKGINEVATSPLEFSQVSNTSSYGSEFSRLNPSDSRSTIPS